MIDFRRFAGEQYSEIARRMTNLFSNPAPREIVADGGTHFLEEGLIHRTERGDLVRSKSELVIADKLYSRGIEYVVTNNLSNYPQFRMRLRGYFWR